MFLTGFFWFFNVYTLSDTPGVFVVRFPRLVPQLRLPDPPAAGLPGRAASSPGSSGRSRPAGTSRSPSSSSSGAFLIDPELDGCDGCPENPILITDNQDYFNVFSSIQSLFADRSPDWPGGGPGEALADLACDPAHAIRPGALGGRHEPDLDLDSARRVRVRDRRRPASDALPRFADPVRAHPLRISRRVAPQPHLARRSRRRPRAGWVPPEMRARGSATHWPKPCRTPRSSSPTGSQRPRAMSTPQAPGWSSCR